jgi:hypothetical protein
MNNDPAVIEEILTKARNIAVAGISDKPARASHHIGSYLAANGYRVFPVNPALKEVLGLPCPILTRPRRPPARRLGRASTWWTSSALRSTFRRSWTT